MRILGIHGLGDHRNTTWEADWREALLEVFPGQDKIQIDCHFLTYDHIFDRVEFSAIEIAKALWNLTRSGVASTLRRRRGLIADVSHRVRWTAGYVVAWLEDPEFGAQTRELVLSTVQDIQPDVVLAHSLGSLITYDAFIHGVASNGPISDTLRRVTYVTLGSQIGNPFVVRNLAAGRIQPLHVKYWHHLYNPEDDVFTAPIRIPTAENFGQVNTPFDIDGPADHSAVNYLKHTNAISSVWQPIVEEASAERPLRVISSLRRTAPRPPERRALLVGIDEYPTEDQRLEGCVNDTFLMSSVLQECGFPPEAIRVCLNRRASAHGILERLEWLVDDPQPGDERVFFYSGHGAQIPEYGINNEPDRLNEILVPWDFDWSADTAIADDLIYSLYSQLPYETRLALIFDCCHSGGIHRHGGSKVRGLNPPDDVRHRAIKWDIKSGMWVPRDFRRLNSRFAKRAGVNRAYFGARGTLCRLGRASVIRGQDERTYDNMKREATGSPVGPYLPLILEACKEDEFAYEYRHGAVSYGAFTWALVDRLRRASGISFEDLVILVGSQLRELGYRQQPQILGPTEIRGMAVPWMRTVGSDTGG